MIRFRVIMPNMRLTRRSYEASIDRLGRAAGIATDWAAQGMQRDFRADMRQARLGGLANSVRMVSDHKRRKVGRLSQNPQFKAGGMVYMDKRNPRTTGTYEAYSEGAKIVPRKGRFLWIATDEIPKRVGRFRMTPERYNNSGLTRRIGELEFIEGKHSGEALLIVRNVTVQSKLGYGKAKRHSRAGKVGKGREKKDFIVAFIGIRQTKRARRIQPKDIFRKWAARVPFRIEREWRRLSVGTGGSNQPASMRLSTRFSVI